MSKLLKGLMRDEIKSRFTDLDGGVFISAQGLNSEKTYSFRSALHAKNIKYTVIRNALARQAFIEFGYAEAEIDKVLQGPLGVVYTGEENSATVSAKAIFAWKKEAKDRTVKYQGAFIDGEMLGPKEAEQLKNAPTKDEARAQLLGVIQAPITQLLGTLREPHNLIVGLLDALQRKREEGGEDSAQPVVS